MGYAWNGVCYQTATAALDAFKLDAVSIDAAGITSFTTAPTINGTGLITWSISHRPLTGTTATTRTGTTQLQTCATESFSQWDIGAIVFIVALFFAAVLGYATGHRV